MQQTAHMMNRQTVLLQVLQVSSLAPSLDLWGSLWSANTEYMQSLQQTLQSL